MSSYNCACGKSHMCGTPPCPQYNLSICCADGDQIYGLISTNKQSLREFLRGYDHEGSMVSLFKRNLDDTLIEIETENIYKELGIND